MAGLSSFARKTAGVISALTVTGTVIALGLVATFCISFLPILAERAEMIQMYLPVMTEILLSIAKSGPWIPLVLILGAVLLAAKEIAFWRRPWMRFYLTLPTCFLAALILALFIFSIQPVIFVDAFRFESNSSYKDDQRAITFRSMSPDGSYRDTQLEKGFLLTNIRDNDNQYYLIADIVPTKNGKNAPRQIEAHLSDSGLAVSFLGKFGIPGLAEDAIALIPSPAPDHLAAYLLDQNGKRIVKEFPVDTALAKKLEKCSTADEILALISQAKKPVIHD